MKFREGFSHSRASEVETVLRNGGYTAATRPNAKPGPRVQRRPIAPRSTPALPKGGVRRAR